MNGINSATGKRLVGISHLHQSLRDIITTPLGSRVMRREYGSRLFSLIDAPMNRSTLLDLYAATAEAIARWEPRFSLVKALIVSAVPGRLEIDLTGNYLPDGKVVTISGIVIGGSASGPTATEIAADALHVLIHEILPTPGYW